MNEASEAAGTSESTCTQCKCSSPWREGFVQIKDGTVRRLCCPTCARRLRSKWSDEADWAVRAYVRNNLACALMYRDDAASLAEALDLATDACSIGPWEPSMLGTRACVLALSAEAGADRVAEARQLLVKRARAGLSRPQRAWTEVILGLCAVADGDLVQARANLGRARSLRATPHAMRLLERRIPSH